MLHVRHQSDAAQRLRLRLRRGGHRPEDEQSSPRVHPSRCRGLRGESTKQHAPASEAQSTRGRDECGRGGRRDTRPEGGRGMLGGSYDATATSHR